MELETLKKTLENRPETYKTIFGYPNKMEIVKFRRKLKWYLQTNQICCGKLNKFKEQTVFFSPKKKYFIFIVQERHEYICIYCKKFEKVSDKWIIYSPNILDENKWIKSQKKIYDERQIMRYY